MLWRDIITSTKLRKHVAAFSQLLNLEENELEILATFLGHDISVHREYYRLPEHTIQLAKCGKLLTMLSEGKCKNYIGKRLDDIDLHLEGRYFELVSMSGKLFYCFMTCYFQVKSKMSVN